jgi:ATP-dependent exoDNAse (exonuclease V) beta subunit
MKLLMNGTFCFLIRRIRLLRTDRLLKAPEGWIIIDFKTGAEREKYEAQIDIYKKALEKSGEKVWKVEVLYI